MNWYGYIGSPDDLKNTYCIPDNMFVGGHSVGIIAVDLHYPKIPGNVANATTFTYPVLYKKVQFDIHMLLRGDPQIKDIIINAALELQQEGARVIIGACGFFANYQNVVAEALDVPVYLSSLIQIPMIKIGLKPSQKIGLLTASADNIKDEMLKRIGVNPADCITKGIEFTDGFKPIRDDLVTLDNDLFCKDVVAAAVEMVNKNPEIGAILLECSDMPPYAQEVQKAVSLPVFDFITMIDWAHHAVVKKSYFGYL